MPRVKKNKWFTGKIAILDKLKATLIVKNKKQKLFNLFTLMLRLWVWAFWGSNLSFKE